MPRVTAWLGSWLSEDLDTTWKTGELRRGAEGALKRFPGQLQKPWSASELYQCGPPWCPLGHHCGWQETSKTAPLTSHDHFRLLARLPPSTLQQPCWAWTRSESSPLHIGEAEALAKDREQSKSKFEFNIIALRGKW